jgi:transposase
MEILDCNGKSVKRSEIKGAWSELARKVAEQCPAPFAVCFEASCGYGYLHEQLGRVSRRVLVAHPGGLRLIYKSKRKNNRADASKLAKLLYLDAVPAVHVPGRDVRLWRQTIEFRQKLLARRVMVKNQVRAMIRERGIPSPRGLWTRKGTAWLRELELEEPAALKRDLLVEELSELSRKLSRVDGQLRKMSDPQPGVTLLRTIPGIGPRTAEALAAYIDDPRRFASVRKAGSYFGWDPCQDASADKNRLGHITRNGPATVRKLMCEAAWTAVRVSPTVKAFYERIKRDDPDRKKIAIVATAHYLTRVAASMLKSGEVWREQQTAATDGGGEHPSRPQGFSPPPGTAPDPGTLITAPSPLRFPSSLCRDGAD